MKEYKPMIRPRQFQQTMLKNVKIGKGGILRPIRRGEPSYIGVDMGRPGGDKTVIARASMDKKGKIFVYFDEYADLPNYKWYRNPIKWWKWRRLIKGITRKEWIGKWKS